jgi:hypothetical protein
MTHKINKALHKSGLTLSKTDKLSHEMDKLSGEMNKTSDKMNELPSQTSNSSYLSGPFPSPSFRAQLNRRSAP